MKEFLVNHDNKWTLRLLDSDTEENSFRVAVPSGAEIYVYFSGDKKSYFYNPGNEIFENHWVDASCKAWSFNQIKKGIAGKILWQRSETEYLMQGENGDKLMESIAELNNKDTVKVSIDELKHRVGVDATLAERQATYGSFEDVACVTQDLLLVLKRTGFDSLPKPHKEALHMICSKMARLVNGDFNHLDSWHDIGGYAKLIENLIGDEDE